MKNLKEEMIMDTDMAEGTRRRRSMGTVMAMGAAKRKRKSTGMVWTRGW